MDQLTEHVPGARQAMRTIAALPSLPLPVARRELLADIARLAGVKAPDFTGRSRDEIALHLRGQVARLGIGDNVRLTLMVIAATALLALERHDELQRPAPAAAARLRDPGAPLPEGV